jgi:hypothetical protein
MLRLTDLTATDSGYGVWFDAIRVRFIKPGAVLQAPIAAFVSNPVHFAWSVTTPESLTAQRLQVAADTAFQNMILDTALAVGARSVDLTVPSPSGPLYWRIRLISTRGDTIDMPGQLFTLSGDTTPPTSSITGVYLYPNGKYAVTWRGQDDAAGISGYNIDYRLSGTTIWNRWLSATASQGSLFVPPQPGAIYWFRSQAIDAVGNVEALAAGDGDANTTQAIILTDHHFLPILPR